MREGKTWLLVHNDDAFIMVPAQGWRLAQVGDTSDANGRSAVAVHFDEAGATRMLQLTQTYGGCPLAMIVKGIVVSAPMILETQGGFNSVVIAGNFTEPELEGMITTLREGMSGQSTKTDANPPVAKPEETSSVLELRIAPRRGLGPDAVEGFIKALAEELLVGRQPLPLGPGPAGYESVGGSRDPGAPGQDLAVGL